MSTRKTHTEARICIQGVHDSALKVERENVLLGPQALRPTPGAHHPPAAPAPRATCT